MLTTLSQLRYFINKQFKNEIKYREEMPVKRERIFFCERRFSQGK